MLGIKLNGNFRTPDLARKFLLSCENRMIPKNVAELRHSISVTRRPPAAIYAGLGDEDNALEWLTPRAKLIEEAATSASANQ